MTHEKYIPNEFDSIRTNDNNEFVAFDFYGVNKNYFKINDKVFRFKHCKETEHISRYKIVESNKSNLIFNEVPIANVKIFLDINDDDYFTGYKFMTNQKVLFRLGIDMYSRDLYICDTNY